MYKKFERKMAKMEYANLLKNITGLFKGDEKKIMHVFEKLMETGEYVWQTGKFTNKISLFYDTNVDIITYNTSWFNGSNLKYMEDIIRIIRSEQGELPQYFLYKNYHKDPVMYRLSDDQCIWGGHTSSLQGEYYNRLQTMINTDHQIDQDTFEVTKSEILSKYVEC